MSDNIVQKKSFQFALEIISLYKELKNEKEFIISKQLLKSGTSIGANVEEAIAAQSRKDFINKMSIAYKEARETNYWLRLLNESRLTEINIIKYLEEVLELNKLLSSIIKSTKEK
ncbi:MAG: four helix bundle protein [Ignavibacteriales bacterium CG12_big_fil_rev_8_21_14_0_65_30_8]|nr:MAG: four helix bundle protein [Ignavibacteriales bacterium CG12_big_fil_rev_8_21_14_0_65_30_8]